MQNKLSELLEKEVYPALWHCLDTAFPDFGFKRKGDHWIATNDTVSRGLPGAPRADRVWVYTKSPFGIKIHGGDFVTWLSYVSGRPDSPRGIDFINAVKDLCQRAGVAFPEIEKPAPGIKKEKNMETFHEEMSQWGREQLLSEPGKPVLDYLISRGLTHEEIEKKTDLCAIPNRKKFMDEFLNQKGYKIEHLKESGLLAWGFGINYQLFFPVRDAHGNIVSWAGRLTVPGKNKDGDDFPKYKNAFGLHKNLPYHFSRAKRAIERTKQVILVEGFMDAAHCFAKGFENVVAILGSRLLPDQLNHLISCGATQILMCLDRDKDGEEGTELAFELFGRLPHLHPYYVILPPNCKDADETLKNFNKTDFDQILKTAQPGWLWYAEQITKGYDINTSDRDQLLNQFAAVYHKISDPVMKDEFIKTLSRQTKIGILTLRRRFGTLKTAKSQETSKQIVEEYGLFLLEVKTMFEKETNLLEVRNLFHQKLSRTSFQSRNPLGKRFKGYLKSGLSLCLRFDIKGIKALTSQEASWVKDQSEMLPITKVISQKG